MAKFYGSVGYAETIQTAPGVHEEQIVEYPYYGDLTRNARPASVWGVVQR